MNGGREILYFEGLGAPPCQSSSIEGEEVRVDPHPNPLPGRERGKRGDEWMKRFKFICVDGTHDGGEPW